MFTLYFLLEYVYSFGKMFLVTWKAFFAADPVANLFHVVVTPASGPVTKVPVNQMTLDAVNLVRRSDHRAVILAMPHATMVIVQTLIATKRCDSHSD